MNLQRPDDCWLLLAKGQVIGHKRILSFAPVEATQLRLRIPQSVAEPVIRRFAAFHIDGNP
jgi:alpha-L-fucosidase